MNPLTSYNKLPFFVFCLTSFDLCISDLFVPKLKLFPAAEKLSISTRETREEGSNFFKREFSNITFLFRQQEYKEILKIGIQSVVLLGMRDILLFSSKTKALFSSLVLPAISKKVALFSAAFFAISLAFDYLKLSERNRYFLDIKEVISFLGCEMLISAAYLHSRSLGLFTSFVFKLSHYPSMVVDKTNSVYKQMFGTSVYQDIIKSLEEMENAPDFNEGHVNMVEQLELITGNAYPILEAAAERIHMEIPHQNQFNKILEGIKNLSVESLSDLSEEQSKNLLFLGCLKIMHNLRKNSTFSNERWAEAYTLLNPTATPNDRYAFACECLWRPQQVEYLF